MKYRHNDRIITFCYTHLYFAKRQQEKTIKPKTNKQKKQKKNKITKSQQ